MQQINPQEAHAYGGYTGSNQYSEHEPAGQKIQGDSDEQFADLLARRIKQELQGNASRQKEITIGYRLALAIVSVCILVPLFIGLIIAMALGLGNNSPAIVWAFIIACGVIFVVNAYFSWASIEISKHQK